MAQDLKDIIEHLNTSGGPADTSDPVSTNSTTKFFIVRLLEMTLCTILSRPAHTSALVYTMSHTVRNVFLVAI